METEKRLKHMIQKYPELVMPLSSNLNNNHQKHIKFKRAVCRSLERSSRSRSFKKTFKPSRRLSQLIIEEYLTCTVCKNLLSVPTTLECGDTFCKSCLPEKISTNCPECRRTVQIEGVKCNVLVQDIVGRVTNKGQDEKLTNHRLACRISHNYKLRSRIYKSYHGQQPLNKFLRPSAKRKREDIETNANVQLNGEQTLVANNNLCSIITTNEALSPLITSGDVDCVLCSRCLFEPVTTTCGHTFCRPCLARVLDYGLACPLCMTQLSGGSGGGSGGDEGENGNGNANDCRVINGTGGEVGAICKALEMVIQRLLPLEYKERVDGYREEIMAVDEDEQIPVFICTSAFPGVACPLYVYEPRYRLLTRRCLQTNKRRFAMAAAVGSLTNTSVTNNTNTNITSNSNNSNNNNNNNNMSMTINTNTNRTNVDGVNVDRTTYENGRFAQYGTILEVHDAVHLQDGTSILTTVGLRRFRVLSRGEKDGYDTARIEYICDLPISFGTLPYLRVLHDRVHRKACRWIGSLAPQIHAEIEQSLGAMPPLESNWYELPDGPLWAWWLMPVLPLSAHLQLGFLSTCSLEKRLRAIDKLLDRISGHTRTQCNCNNTNGNNIVMVITSQQQQQQREQREQHEQYEQHERQRIGNISRTDDASNDLCTHADIIRSRNNNNNNNNTSTHTVQY